MDEDEIVLWTQLTTRINRIERKIDLIAEGVCAIFAGLVAYTTLVISHHLWGDYGSKLGPTEDPKSSQIRRSRNPGRYGIALAAALVAGSTGRATSAFGFDAEGLRTGMTVNEVAAQVRPRGLTVSPFVGSGQGEKFGVYSIMKIDPSSRVDLSFPIISLAFCDGRLVSFNHNIDLDTDYIPTLKSLLERYGNPGRVRVTTSPWSGPGDGYLSESSMDWYSGNDRVTLSFTPEGRTAGGTLRYSRRGAIAYQTQSQRCPFPDW